MHHRCTALKVSCVVLAAVSASRPEAWYVLKGDGGISATGPMDTFPGRNGFSFTAWLRPAGLTSERQTVLAFGDQNGSSYNIAVSDEAVHLHLIDKKGKAAGATIAHRVVQNGEWLHFALVHEWYMWPRPAKLTLFVNGISVGEGSMKYVDTYRCSGLVVGGTLNSRRGSARMAPSMQPGASCSR